MKSFLIIHSPNTKESEVKVYTTTFPKMSEYSKSKNNEIINGVIIIKPIQINLIIHMILPQS